MRSSGEYCILWVLLVLVSPPSFCVGFTTLRRKHGFGRIKNHVSTWDSSKLCSNRRGSSMQMRDRSSSYWFNVGESVRVVDDVMKAGSNLKGREGVVIQTWEKCDVDPTCCCAEQVDLGMAVHVKFATEDSIITDDFFIHYFAEDELVVVKKEQALEEQVVTEASESTTPPVVAFDGLSCKAFKLDHLKMGKQAQRIAQFEASRTDTE
uniref:Uncharacterized protein n=1 Tax=Attheya septentrionalis TaxID=420275 RepID=A0A7S2UIX4_9STRA|mmetsp:Transcript_27424/g.49803  ORF Transcript_27424/g.49803 Transcript_27424/m.49803 type:complete len:208 (+) Transcript_27424:110-733(+)|eukprot:CAMPEP_0198292620 /NCGR_PEP_ID=MMETSP1449-20131203/12997_1 /TAXON_ID=420275 /ORGANISM="Attheya septentrionalis, Strain CCMP2084" /LENGTH=207 /DNA_ID=CAMNT_0043991819 /DNA_START=54 /DNA_END=677 /DNA_ORIENTATION=+